MPSSQPDQDPVVPPAAVAPGNRADGPPQDPAPAPLLECRGVARLFPDGNVIALQGVNLTIRPGEFTALMGPSGSGKSTLLHILGGLDRPTQGEVLFEGRPLRGARQLDDLRINKVGFVFQAFHLLPTLTAVENVQVPMFEGPLSAAQRRQGATDLLAQVGMSHRLHHLPNQLSAGEKQRVAIARALANDPAVLLADEPTGNLDTATGRAILELFERVHRERAMTLFLVTHGPEVARRAHRLIRLRDGRVVEDRQQAPST